MIQSDELHQLITLIRGQFINETGTAKLTELGIFKAFVLSLSKDDVQQLVDGHIFFNPIWSPASVSNLNRSLPVPAKIITIDINAMAQFSVEEGVAVILHEIGHAINPDIKGMDGEFIADDYAASRGFGDFIVSSLEQNREKFPQHYDNDSTTQRITRIRGKV